MTKWTEEQWTLVDEVDGDLFRLIFLTAGTNNLSLLRTYYHFVVIKMCRDKSRQRKAETSLRTPHRSVYNIARLYTPLSEQSGLAQVCGQERTRWTQWTWWTAPRSLNKSEEIPVHSSTNLLSTLSTLTNLDFSRKQTRGRLRLRGLRTCGCASGIL